MSNDIINLDDFQVPAYLQNGDVTTSSSLVTQRESVPRISIRGHRFRLKKDGEETVASAGAPLNIVVLGADPEGKRCAKSYYASAYVQDSDEPPDCSSADGIKPDDWIVNPVCSNCAQCPMNEWGSAKGQDGKVSKGKACQDVKRLLVVAPNNIEKGDVYLLQVPPTSLSALSKYGRALAKHNLPVEACVTKVEFADTEYPELIFNLAGFLKEDQAKVAQHRSLSDEVQDLIHKAQEMPVEQVKQPEPDKEEPPRSSSGSIFPDDEDLDDPGTNRQEQAPKVELDAAGEAWDPEKHAASKSKTKDGYWTKARKRKSNGAAEPEKKEPPKQEESGGFEQPDQPPTGSALDDILAGKW